MRAVLVALIAMAACRIELDHHEFDDAQNVSGRVCQAQASTVPSCAAAVGQNTLTYVQANILQPKCAAFSNCHGTDGTQDNLDLTTAAKSFTNLVSLPSKMDITRMLVVPGDVNASFLTVMTGGIKPGEASPALAAIPNGVSGATDGKAVGTMPYNNPPMCCEKIDAISAWIAAGAINN
jgi:hypothetical protein